MPDVMLFLINWAVSFSYGTLLFLILRLFLPLRKKHILLEIAEVYLITVLSNIVIYPGEITGTFGSFLALFVVLLVFHRSSFFLKVSATILIFPVMTAIAFILQDAGSLVWLYVFEKNMPSPGQDLLHTFTMVLRIPIWYAVFCCVKVWIPHAIHDLTRRMWILIDLVSLASFIGIITVIFKSTSYTSYLAYPACIASLATNLGCCYLCTYMAQTIRTEMQLEVYQYQQAYYTELEKGQQAVRSLRHDMKNHLNMIATLLMNQEYDDAARYLREMNQEFTVSMKAYCPNSTVNAVLNVKEHAAISCGIRCELQIDLQESPGIDNVDLCSLFSNTLDNAIEACQKIPDVSSRFLTLKTRCKNSYFSFEITNSKANTISETAGHYETDKKDKRLHGIGIENVKRIVGKYQGEMQIEHQENLFSIVILLPVYSSAPTS